MKQTPVALKEISDSGTIMNAYSTGKYAMCVCVCVRWIVRHYF